MKAFHQQKLNGYLRIDLFKANGTKKQESVHVLVARMFIPNPMHYPEVHHKDENKDNCTVANLEWTTRIYNQRYSESRANHHAAKLTEVQVTYIKQNYKPRDKIFGATAMAKQFGVDTSQISKIGRDLQWKEADRVR